MVSREAMKMELQVSFFAFNFLRRMFYKFLLSERRLYPSKPGRADIMRSSRKYQTMGPNG